MDGGDYILTRDDMSVCGA